MSSDRTIYGQQSTLSASDSRLALNIEDAIVKYPDIQIPLLKRLNSKVFKKAVSSHTYSWTEKEARPVVTEVASEEVAADATSFYVKTPGVFNVDDVLQKPSGEVMIVTAVSGGTLLTVQHWTGTAETLALGDTVRRIGVASRQGALADNMVITGPRDLYNHSQIFEDVVEMSDSEHNAFIHGDENSGQLISDKQKELMEMLQASLLVGTRHKDVPNKRYSMGGLKYFIDEYASENVIDFGGSSTWTNDTSVIDKFEDAVEKIAQNWGNKPTVYMGYKAMRKFRMIQDDTLKSGRKDKARGIGVATTYLSQLGDLDVVMMMERTGVLNDLIFFVDESAFGYKAYRNRGWNTKELPFAGDGHVWQVLGEYTCKVQTPKVFSYVHNLGL